MICRKASVRTYCWEPPSSTVRNWLTSTPLWTSVSKTRATAPPQNTCPCVPPYQSTPISALMRAGSRGPGGPPSCVVNKAAPSFHCVYFVTTASDRWAVFGAEQQKSAPSTCSTASAAPRVRKPAATPRRARRALPSVWTAASVQLVNSSAFISSTLHHSSLVLKYNHLPTGTVYDDVGHSGCVPRSECPCSHNGRLYSQGESFSRMCKKWYGLCCQCRAWLCI